MIRTHSPRRNPNLTMEILRKIHRTHGDYIEIIIFGTDSDNPDYRVLANTYKDFKCFYQAIFQTSLMVHYIY